MTWKVLIAHATGEEQLAERLAEPIRKAGYEVAHQGTVLAGESPIEEASKLLQAVGPVVLCGTVIALGTGWAHRIVNAARTYHSVRVFAVQMDQNAYVQALSLDGRYIEYWRDPDRAMRQLIDALNEYYPLDGVNEVNWDRIHSEQRYCTLALASYDIIDLANLPENDVRLATERLLLRNLYVPLRISMDKAAREARQQLVTARNLAHKHDPELREAITRLYILNPLPQETDSVGRFLSHALCWVILGDPGAGKSTLLRWIATSYLLKLKGDPEWNNLPDVQTLPDRKWLPVLVRCRELDKHNLAGNLEDILEQTFKKLEMTSAEAKALCSILPAKLSDGEILLLIDGLDEIPSSTARTLFARQIQQIQNSYPKIAIIVTSRIVGYREMGYRLDQPFMHSTVQDLSRTDKDKFAERWAAVTELPSRRQDSQIELDVRLQPSRPLGG